MEEKVEQLERRVAALESVLLDVMQKLVNEIGLDLARELAKEITDAKHVDDPGDRGGKA